ncbi:pentapeptide repeat-containing protein [Brevibacillus brevis]|nr:pentapeptide repeat-containing protein [Brevibacillus brevis]
MEIEDRFSKHIQWTDSAGDAGKKIEWEKVEVGNLNITGQNLSCMLIVESKMNHSILTNNDMSDGYFLGTSFDAANLSESILSKTVFNYGSFKHTSLKKCLCIKASFDDADLSYADLSGADLQRASFRGANLSYANFSHANLKGAVLDGALLYKTRFVDAKGVEEWIVQNDIHTATYIKKPR